jgi:hypothetical protein
MYTVHCSSCEGRGRHYFDDEPSRVCLSCEGTGIEKLTDSEYYRRSEAERVAERLAEEERRVKERKDSFHRVFFNTVPFGAFIGFCVGFFSGCNGQLANVDLGNGISTAILYGLVFGLLHLFWLKFIKRVI